MTLERVRREVMSDQVIARLRRQITSGAWPVGFRIPSEPELVEQLGVARNTVREAVRALAHTGLLDIRHGSGTYVRATSELAGVMRGRFAEATIEEVTEVRGALEARAARLAAARRTPEDLQRLDSALAQRERAWSSGDRIAFVNEDAAFHLAVVAASHNMVLVELHADLGEVIRESLLDHFRDTLRPEQYQDHARLVEAIRAQDSNRAAYEAGSYTAGWMPWPEPNA
ncbi:FadR/GntR family transcriptional regulator [Streptomyces caelestis]|jgi:DNA-binding FadR family transcriptional regulator|uniref:DNA-binding FadR family transcriptional regulator n=1 Tax=Streptomyces caelestis TaxID=36816 RepID=A0A7W9LR23_9ACTN|nr:FCD domain-containing protein [Streptomyces caelestis]MBB5792899.1 DNA-binding FadR family transcriptional regulator [Streptomyces caelestis]GGW75741.1 GntR family transcriptional regulator [Streptomyces caelestis]